VRRANVRSELDATACGGSAGVRNEYRCFPRAAGIGPVCDVGEIERVLLRGSYSAARYDENESEKDASHGNSLLKNPKLTSYSMQGECREKNSGTVSNYWANCSLSPNFCRTRVPLTERENPIPCGTA